MKHKKVFYYDNELTDEVVSFNVKKKKIDKNYKYIHKNIFYKAFSWFSYRFLAMPFFAFYLTFIRPVKFVNKKVLKQTKNSGYFIYGNHSNMLGDGASPTFICFPKKPHIICNSDNVSLPFWGKYNKMWGALPIPDTMEAVKNFHTAIELTLKNKNPIVIYPEAHLWPYYTDIRPFTSLSFKYPIKYNKPAYTFTTTYVKRKLCKIPKAIIYIDGPFYPDLSINEKLAQQKLRDEIYNKMVERSKISNYKYIIYKKRSKND